MADGVVVTRTAACACGGSITIVVPAGDDSLTEAQEITLAVRRHNRTPAHVEMSRLWASEWLHPGDPGYPYEEVLPDA